MRVIGCSCGGWNEKMIKTVQHHHFSAGITRLLLAAMLCMAAPSLHAQDYSSFFSGNGSFESGSSPPPLNFPGQYSSVNTITGWRLVAGGTYPQWLEDGKAQDGVRYVQLRATGGSQPSYSAADVDGYMISPTPFTVGEIYELTFWAAGGVGTNNQLLVGLSSPMGDVAGSYALPSYTQLEFDALPGLAWGQYSFTFAAIDTTMDLNVSTLLSNVGGFSSSVYLDNFTLMQVPEPGSALLTAAGGLVLLAVRRRRDAR
jgi:hypothetical protein